MVSEKVSPQNHHKSSKMGADFPQLYLNPMKVNPIGGLVGLGPDGVSA